MLSRLPARAKRKCILFVNFQRRREAKMAIFNFRRFWKNSSALGSFNCIFENNSLKALFGQNMKKVKILKLSPDSRYLQKLALKVLKFPSLSLTLIFWTGQTPGTFLTSLAPSLSLPWTLLLLDSAYGSQIVAKFKRQNICQNQQLDTYFNKYFSTSTPLTCQL